MKKLLLTLAAVVGMFAADSGYAWAASDPTETLYTGYTAASDDFKSHDIVGNSFTIPGTCVADWASVTSFKLRTGQTVDNKIGLRVTEGHMKTRLYALTMGINPCNEDS